MKPISQVPNIYFEKTDPIAVLQILQYVSCSSEIKLGHCLIPKSIDDRDSFRVIDHVCESGDENGQQKSKNCNIRSNSRLDRPIHNEATMRLFAFDNRSVNICR